MHQVREAMDCVAVHVVIINHSLTPIVLDQNMRQEGPPSVYRRFGRSNRICTHCRAMFWDEQEVCTSATSTGRLYDRCCSEGRVKLLIPQEYPPFIQTLFSNTHFLENIRLSEHTTKCLQRRL